MARYKFVDENGNTVNDTENGRYGIHSGSRFWLEYQEWLAEGNVTDPYMSKQEAHDRMVTEVNAKNREENSKFFMYNGNNYVADIESIQAVAIESFMMSQTDPIPTPNGVWKTADVDEAGEPVYIPYTCAEYTDFKTAFYKRSSDNFGVKEFHKAQLRALLNDENSSINDIMNYDYSQGWF